MTDISKEAPPMDKAALEALIAKVELKHAKHKPVIWLCDETERLGLSLSLVSRAYDGSLDAAKSLHSVTLPGFEYGYDGSIAWVKMPGLRSSFRASLPNGYTARAWLLAILKALLSQAKGEG